MTKKQRTWSEETRGLHPTKLPYQKATAEIFYLRKTLSILEQHSLEGNIEDFEDGEDL